MLVTASLSKAETKKGSSFTKANLHKLC